jgi:hypothetical protein
MLRELFEAVLRRCRAEDLFSGEAFAGDASLIKGDANRQRRVPRREDLPAAAGASAIDEYVSVRLDNALTRSCVDVTVLNINYSTSYLRV